MTLTQPPTFEQMPSFLAGLANEVLYIKEALKSTPVSAEIEKPTDVSGAAEHTNLDEQTIYRWVRERKIPFHKQGRKLYFYKSELNDWIKTGRGKTAEEIATEAEHKLLAANKGRGKTVRNYC